LAIIKLYTRVAEKKGARGDEVGHVRINAEDPRPPRAKFLCSKHLSLVREFLWARGRLGQYVEGRKQSRRFDFDPVHLRTIPDVNQQSFLVIQGRGGESWRGPPRAVMPPRFPADCRAQTSEKNRSALPMSWRRTENGGYADYQRYGWGGRAKSPWCIREFSAEVRVKRSGF